MKLNAATDYAFRMVLHLSGVPFGTKITGSDLAKAQSIPDRFLLKIMRNLTAAHIMQSYRGVDGGFSLQRKPKDITLLDVVEAVEGPLLLQRCLGDVDVCTKQSGGFCSIHCVFSEMQNDFRAHLQSITFEYMAKKELEIQKALRQDKNLTEEALMKIGFKHIG